MSPRLTLALLAVTSGCQWSCGAAQDTGYAAANADCVALAKSTAQSELCVSRLQTMYCGDGGLNAPMCGKDAGHE